MPPDRLAGSRTRRLRRHLDARLRRHRDAARATATCIDAHSNTGARDEHRREPDLVPSRLPRAEHGRRHGLLVVADRRAPRLPAASRDGECERRARRRRAALLLTPELDDRLLQGGDARRRTGAARPSTRAANGYVRSEGAGVVVLKPLAQALADGDPIYAVIRGTAVNQDGRTTGLTVPSARAQAGDAARRARARGCRAARRCSTSRRTAPGRRSATRSRRARIGAVLATGRAAGRPLPRSARSRRTSATSRRRRDRRPDQGRARARAPARSRRASTSRAEPGDRLRRLRLRVVDGPSRGRRRTAPAMAGVNSFGFGGTNAHVVLRGAPPAPAHGRVADGGERPPQLLHALRAQRGGAARARAALPRARVAATTRRRSATSATAAAAARASRASPRRRRDDARRSSPTRSTRSSPASSGRAVAAGRAARGHQASSRSSSPAWARSGGAWAASSCATSPCSARRSKSATRVLAPVAGWSLLEELGRDEATLASRDADLAQVDELRDPGRARRAVARVGHHARRSRRPQRRRDGRRVCRRRAEPRGRRARRLPPRPPAGTARPARAGCSPSASRRKTRSRCSPASTELVSLAAVNARRGVTLSGDARDAPAHRRRSSSERRLRAHAAGAVPYHSAEDGRDPRRALVVARDARAADGTVPMVSIVTGQRSTAPSSTPTTGGATCASRCSSGTASPSWPARRHPAFLEVGPHPVLAASVNECLRAAGTGGHGLRLAAPQGGRARDDAPRTRRVVHHRPQARLAHGASAAGSTSRSRPTRSSATATGSRLRRATPANRRTLHASRGPRTIRSSAGRFARHDRVGIDARRRARSSFSKTTSCRGRWLSGRRVHRDCTVRSGATFPQSRAHHSRSRISQRAHHRGA